MNNSQRAAAERLVAEHQTLFMNDLPDWCEDAFYILRELLAEPQQRKPLSDEQVRQIVVEASTSSAIKRDGSTSMRIARAIEKAVWENNK